MADDEFDIDIYGDTNPEQEVDLGIKKDEGDESEMKIDGLESTNGHATESNGVKHEEEQDEDYVDIKTSYEDRDSSKLPPQQKIKSTDEPGGDILNIPKQAPQQQGVKRKEGSDDRPIDPGATTALLISELHWWNTDDDIRGWVNQAQVEDELKDITFSEHKVNGKSKGQAYVEFSSQQAATAAKHKIDAFGEGQQYVKKHTVVYSNPNVNPFRTLPKDAPLRAGKEGQSNPGRGGYNNDRGSTNGNFGGNFRGRTPGYNTRGGGMNNNMNNFNRNFSGPAMGNLGGGFNSGMGGFPTGPMANQFGGGFNNRGGMMGGGMRGGGLRGGRGGMNGMMAGMPMGGMPMGGMAGGMAGGMGGMPMNMGQMGGGMPGAGGFNGMPGHFNPAFFQGNQAAGGDWQNPHGAKRPRPE